MPLPKIDLPIFELKLVSLPNPVKFRPFLVKEEKLLLMALQGEDEDNIYNTIKQVINNCLVSEIDIDKLPIFDVEYLFLNVRARSMGEKIESYFMCRNVVDKEKDEKGEEIDVECKNLMPVNINILEIKPPISDLQKKIYVPSVFIYGGSILPGKFKGKDVTVVDVFEAVGKHSNNQMSDEDLEELEISACPSAGACGGQFTANTMACVSEAIGLALPYSSGTPAPYEERDKYAYASRQAVMSLLKKNIRPRDIVTLKSLQNAATVVAATGGSTNAALHLPAIANECGIKFDLMDVAKIFKKTP